jgi:hypothetical protein
MQLEVLNKAVSEFTAKDAAFATAIDAKASELTVNVSAKADEFKAYCDQQVAAFKIFITDGFAKEADAALEVRLKFQEFLEYCQMLDQEAARLRREAEAFAVKIDPPPDVPGELKVNFTPAVPPA